MSESLKCSCGTKIDFVSPIPSVTIGWFKGAWEPYQPPLGFPVLACYNRDCFELTGPACIKCLPGVWVRTYRRVDENRTKGENPKPSATYHVCPKCNAQYDGCPSCDSLLVIEEGVQPVPAFFKGIVVPVDRHWQMQKCSRRGCGFKTEQQQFV